MSGFKDLGLVLLVGWGVFLPMIAYMQAPFVVCTGPGTIEDFWGFRCTLADLIAVPVRIFNFLLSAAASVLLLMIVWAGVRMAMYWFNEQPEQELVAARLTLTRGIVGFVIVATAMLMINILARIVLGLYLGYPIINWLGGLIYF